MSPDDRASAIDLLLARQDRLIETISSFSTEQWSFRAVEGTSTSAECVEHIDLVEMSLVHKLKIDAGGAPPGETAKALAEGKDPRVLRAVPDRRRCASAPKSFRPSRNSTLAEATGRFSQTRGLPAEFARSTTANLCDIV